MGREHQLGVLPIPRAEDPRRSRRPAGPATAWQTAPAGHGPRANRTTAGRGWLFAGDEVGDPLGLVDLDVVPGAVEQVQLAVGEQRGEVAGDPRVEVAVAGAEDHPDRWGKAA